jgi:predicted N-acetyltransferase YhbS
MITYQELTADRLPTIWRIDRSEVIEKVYHLRNGELVLEREFYDLPGWPPGLPDSAAPVLAECLKKGGLLLGAVDGGMLIGAAVLESRFMGHPPDQLQLVFLHVSREYRGRGVGRKLFLLAAGRARELGARRLYISATPSENTVNFYLGLGCVLVQEPDPRLFAEEPEDIHLEYHLLK